jgi:tubulin beta
VGIKFWEVVCDEHGIGGSGEYYGDNDAHLSRIKVFYHEALLGKYVPCAVRSALRPRARRFRRCNPKSPLGELITIYIRGI